MESAELKLNDMQDNMTKDDFEHKDDKNISPSGRAKDNPFGLTPDQMQESIIKQGILKI